MKRSQFQALPCLYSIIMIMALSLSIGCGYHFRADGAPVGIKIESLAIPLMTSASSNIGFESDFTRVIREEFISHSKVPLVSRERAGAVLKGSIYEISTEPLTFDLRQQDVQGNPVTYAQTNQRRLKIKLDARLIDMDTGKIIWRDMSLTEEANYDVGTDPLANRYNRKQALERIARRLAKRIYLKTVERF